MTAVLELQGITKRFPGVVANDQVDLEVAAGTVHALVGENGAGKTTLMSILYGLHAADEGQIRVQGQDVRFRSSAEAIHAGLGMVHQHFKLFGSLTVAENVIYGAETGSPLRIDRRAAEARVRELAESYGLAVDPRAKVETLPVGVQQRVEILKALYREASILILDEPTAVLTPQERDGLFDVMQRLRESGHTMLFVTHKLGEVMSISDEVTVLRRGRSVAHLTTSATDPVEISRHMTGRDVDLTIAPATREPGEAILEVEGLTVTGDHGRPVVDDVSFEIRAGEIVAIAAVAGNGQAELVEALTGLRDAAAGRIVLGGDEVTDASIAQRRRSLSYIPEDRYRVGTAGRASVAENLVMGYQRSLRSGWRLDPARMEQHAQDLVDRFDIRVEDLATRVDALSGGNMQKVVVAREMAHHSPLLIADQPTRGVDIGSIEFIHHLLAEARDQGAGLLLISAELSEILSLASRILVMFEGRIVAELDPTSTDESDIGLHMTGAGV